MDDAKHPSSARSTPTPVQGADTIVVADSSARGDALVVTAVGASVGRYVVLEEIGRGGMGRVLRAYDPKLQREVALKEVRSRLLGPAGARRLVAEARAMAKLSHPNVVAVYDVEETADGHVVLVMELVAGQTLRTWLQEQRSWRDTLACFRRAGRGLAAAHAAGLLHRDFKPDNVLIAEAKVVKVTDFGLAKLAGHDTQPADADASERGASSGSASEGLTATGVVLGTPRYMAPEQHRGESLTSAADQFAYCVALWDALTGSPPFDGRGLAQLERAKTEGPPLWPPGPTPRPIADAIRRGLSPEPSQRWASMDDLLDALSFDPARRRRRWLQTAAGIGVVGVCVAGVQTWASTRAQRCTETSAAAHLEGAWDEARRTEVKGAMLGIGASYATEVWTRTERSLDDYATAWRNMHVDACEATTVRGEQSTAVMDVRMACLHRANVDLAAVTKVLAHADAHGVQKAHDVIAGLRPLERCADVEALQADVEPPLPEDLEAVEASRAYLAEAIALRKAGRLDEDERVLAAARAEIADVDYAPAHAEIAIEDANLLDMRGDYPAAEAVLREALRVASTQRQWDVVQDAAMMLLYVVGARLHRVDEGVAYFDLALGLAAGDPRREAGANNNFAGVLFADGKYAEAEVYARRGVEIWEASLDLGHPELATGLNQLANILATQKKYEEAKRIYRRAFAAQEQRLGQEHPDTATTHMNLAAVLYSEGKFEEGDAELRPAVTRLETALGPHHPHVIMGLHNLAAGLQARGEYAEAEAGFRDGLTRLEAALGPESLEAATTHRSLANALIAQGKRDEAEAEYRRALALREKALRPDHPDVVQSREDLADLERTRDRPR